MCTHAIFPQDKANQCLTCAKFVRVNARLGPGSIFSAHLFNPVPNEGVKPGVISNIKFQVSTKKDRSVDLSFFKQKPLLKYLLNELDEH